MCVGIPMRVVDMRDVEAVCDRDGETVVIDMSLVGAQPPDTWVLTFLGAAREVISSERASQIDDALLAVKLVQSGTADQADIDALFPDLVNREPQRPESARVKGTATRGDAD